MNIKVRSLARRWPGHRRKKPEGTVWRSGPSAPKFLAAAVLLSTFACLSWAADTNSPSSDDLPPLRPPRAEIPPTFWQQHQAWILAGGLFLVVLIGVAVWLVLRPKPPRIIPPAIRAREALEPLRNQPENGLVLSKVSQILRAYFAATFQLPEGELTTAEFVRLVIQQEAVGPQLATAVNEFLQNCDRRKFAPLGPLPPLGAVSGAAQLIEQGEARRAALTQAPAKP